MRYTSHNCWLLFLCGQVFRTWQTPMETASSSREIVLSPKEFASSWKLWNSHLDRKLGTVSETARMPWALPKCDGGRLRYDELVPSRAIGSKSFSQTSDIRSQVFECESFFGNLKEEDLAAKDMVRMKEFLDEWLGRTTSSMPPASPGLQHTENSKDPTIAVQRIFTSLLHNEMSEEDYGPWIDMFTYIIKADLKQQGLQPATEHMLYGLQSLAIKHQGRADSHLSENLESLVSFLIDKFKATHGSQNLGAWAQLILFPEMVFSSDMKKFENFAKYVSYEPSISAILADLNALHDVKKGVAVYASKYIKASSARGGPQRPPELETVEESSGVDDDTVALLLKKPHLPPSKLRKEVLFRIMRLLGKANFVLGLAETTEVSAQTKTAVVMLLYHLALPSLEWARDTLIPKWAAAQLRTLEILGSPLSHIPKLVKKIRQELEN